MLVNRLNYKGNEGADCGYSFGLWRSLYFCVNVNAKLIVFHMLHGSEACYIYSNKWTVLHALE